MPEFTVTECTKLNDFAVRMRIDCPEIAQKAQPGQFLHILCGEGRILRRPISIADVDGATVTIMFEIKGSGTEWLAERAAGDRLDILGPLGNGFTLPDGDIVVIGGGIGVPPMLYTAKCARGKTTALLGFRDKSHVMLEAEFKQVCADVCITTDDESYGEAGPVILPLERILQDGARPTVLACGPRGMLRAIAWMCAEYDVLCHVSLEERMGCGVGACLVCACKTEKDGQEQMSRVCKDGPVFDAREVSW